MENTVAAPQTVQKITVDVIYIAIADKVRTDTQSQNKPIHVETLAALFPDMKPEEIVNHLAEMVKVERYKDIQVQISSSGAAYLYSEKFISPENANEKIVAEETQTKIAEQVRQDSEKYIRLTPLSSLGEVFPDLEPDKVKQHALAILEDITYPDIRQVAGPTGLVYLYSVDHMTETYARLLARVEANDPAALVAETVREESLIYPRPTKVALFYAPVFQLQECNMPMIVESVLTRPEYKDIKKIDAPTGAIYLYSEMYMDPDLAERYVQWEEVERLTSQ
jgi:hypothetical protein